MLWSKSKKFYKKIFTIYTFTRRYIQLDKLYTLNKAKRESCREEFDDDEEVRLIHQVLETMNTEDIANTKIIAGRMMTHDNMILIIGGLGALTGVAVIVVMVLSICWCKKEKKLCFAVSGQ